MLPASWTWKDGRRTNDCLLTMCLGHPCGILFVDRFSVDRHLICSSSYTWDCYTDQSLLLLLLLQVHPVQLSRPCIWKV